MIESKSEKNLCFIDSNLWLYAFITSQNPDKSIAARSVIQNNDIIISTQVINEVCINFIRKALFSEEKIREIVKSFYNKYSIKSFSIRFFMPLLVTKFIEKVIFFCYSI